MRQLLAGAATTAAALAVLGHAGPAVLGRGAWRRRVLPGLVGVGAPGGVALTFDDGPDPEGTPAVRRALDALGVRATFFVLGQQVLRHPGTVSSLLADGHEVALHGHEHRNHLARTAPALLRDLRRAHDAVVADAGPAAGPAAGWLRFTRPPYGAVSGGTLLAARAVGLRPVLWTAWGRDWLVRTPEQVAAEVVAGLTDGGTVLLHDSDCTSTPLSWRATAAALPRVVGAVQERGWQVRRLADHLADRQPAGGAR